MKKLFLLLGLSLALNAAETVVANSEQEVLDQLNEYYNAFKNQDVKQIESFWTEDAELSLPGFADDLEGKEEISKLMLDRYNQNQNATIHVKSVKVTFPEKDKAVVTGYVQLEKNGRFFEERAGKLELVKENGKWLLDDVEEISSIEGNGKTLDFPLKK